MKLRRKNETQKSPPPGPLQMTGGPTQTFLVAFCHFWCGLRFFTLVRQRPDEAWRWGTRSVPKFHSESSLRVAIHTQVSVIVDVCTYLTICWAESAQIHRGGPVKNFGKVSCRSQIERRTSHSSGTKEDPDFQRSQKLNWTPNRNRGWVEACAHAR